MVTVFWGASVRRFRSDESGTSSVEFVIIFPAIVIVILTFVAISTYIATLSDVQQVASDLARQSVRYVDMGENQDELCNSLSDDILPGLTQQFSFATETRITGVDCTMSADRTDISVSVTYDLNGHYIQRFGKTVGLDVGVFTRSGFMKL